MSLEDDTRSERVTIERPAVYREEIRRSDGSTGWWIAALVAVIAVMALVFLYTNTQPRDAELQAAQDAGRAQAAIDNAANQAQSAAAAATAASANAADSMARASRAAADNAARAADQTAQSVDSAASNASDTVSDATTPNPQ